MDHTLKFDWTHGPPMISGLKDKTIRYDDEKGIEEGDSIECVFPSETPFGVSRVAATREVTVAKLGSDFFRTYHSADRVRELVANLNEYHPGEDIGEWDGVKLIRLDDFERIRPAPAGHDPSGKDMLYAGPAIVDFDEEGDADFFPGDDNTERFSDAGKYIGRIAFESAVEHCDVADAIARIHGACKRQETLLDQPAVDRYPVMAMWRRHFGDMTHAFLYRLRIRDERIYDRLRSTLIPVGADMLGLQWAGKALADEGVANAKGHLTDQHPAHDDLMEGETCDTCRWVPPGEGVPGSIDPGGIDVDAT